MGYNEEEKKAIEYLKDVLELANKLPEGELRLMDAEIEAIKTLINEYKTSLKARFELQRRVEKQQKEIEQYKLLNANIEKANTIINDYISKDKIRAKINKLNNSEFIEDVIAVPYLKELLEEE